MIDGKIDASELHTAKEKLANEITTAMRNFYVNYGYIPEVETCWNDVSTYDAKSYVPSVAVALAIK